MSRSGFSAVSAMVSTGWASGSRFSTVGCVIVRGSSGRTRLTLSRTSCVATSASLSSVKFDDDLRHTFGGGRGQGVDAADRVDGFLDLVGDLAFDLLRRRAGQTRRDEDRRDIDVRELVDAELGEGEDADDGQRENQDRCEDRAANAESGEPLHADYCPLVMRMPSASCATLLVATASPALTPLVISIRSSTVWPVVTMRSSADASRQHDEDASRACVGADGGRRHEHRRCLRGLFDPRGGEEPRLQLARLVGNDRLDDERTRVCLHGGRDVANLAREGPARIRVHLERHGAAGGDGGEVLPRDGELDTQGSDAHHRRDLRAAR